MKNNIFPSLLTVIALALTGCQTHKSANAKFQERELSRAVVLTNKLNPDLLQPPTDMFVLGPGDKLEIDMQGSVTSHAPATVGLDGKVYFSMLPGVDVSGLTLSQTKNRLETELSNYFSRVPQVSLSLKEVVSKQVWVLGRVNRPGIYPIVGSLTLLEALSSAGGTATATGVLSTQNLADLRHSFVMRHGKFLPVNFVRLLQEGDMSQNIYLKPDDFVFLPSSISQQVYVLGAVANPRAVPYGDNMTIVSALANVNGYVKNAYMSHIAILRGSLTEPHIFVVDYKAIIAGKSVDVPLEPGDVIFIPLTPYRFLSDYADLIVTTFVTTWSANMGVRSVTGSGNVTTSVPLKP